MPTRESGAILWYFGEGSRFVPDDRYERAQVLQWMFFEQYEHEPTIAIARFLISYSQLPREQYERRLPRLHTDGMRALDVMEGHLSGRPWFVGESMTLADLALYAYTHVASEGGFELAPYAAINEWLGRVADQPGHVTIDA